MSDPMPEIPDEHMDWIDEISDSESEVWAAVPMLLDGKQVTVIGEFDQSTRRLYPWFVSYHDEMDLRDIHGRGPAIDTVN